MTRLANRPTASDAGLRRGPGGPGRGADWPRCWTSPPRASWPRPQAQVAQAEASLAQLLDRPKAEDVAVAQAQVDEASVALAQAESQLDDCPDRGAL